jgi:hypothetical protein
MPRGFASYQFTDPVEVPPGDYWLSVSQLSLDNMTLGADISRNGFDLVVSGESPRYRYIHDSPYGSQYAVNANSGDISRMLAFEMPARSGNWKPLTPENALDSLNGFAFRGPFIPMIRPLVGNGKPMAQVERIPTGSDMRLYPNPFERGSQTLRISSATGQSITILNLLGQPVRRLGLSVHEAEWDGKDDLGQVVMPGLYFVVSGDAAHPLVVR